MTLLPAPFTWTFTSASGESRTIHVRSRFRVDAPGSLRSLLQTNTGVSVLDQFNAQEGMRAGRLVRLLPEWSLPAAGIYAVFAPGKQVSAKVRSFVDFYRHYVEHRRAVSAPPDGACGLPSPP